MENKLPHAKHFTRLFLLGVAGRRVVVGLRVVGLRVVVIGGHLPTVFSGIRCGNYFYSLSLFLVML